MSVSGWRAERSEAKPVRLNANVSLAGGEKTTVGQPGQRPPPTLKRLPDLQGLSRPPDTNNLPPRADAGPGPPWHATTLPANPPSPAGPIHSIPPRALGDFACVLCAARPGGPEAEPSGYAYKAPAGLPGPARRASHL